MTVETMLNSMSSEELTYWMAFRMLENEESDNHRRTEEVKNKVRR